jgi:hypothetical protein
MSSIYKEAVRIKSHIGYQYLWIDSLCIIQDLPSDWEKEAASMAAVYGNSTCNIAFSLPPEIRYGRDREDPRALGACILRPATASIDGIYTFSHTIPCRQYNTPAGPQHLASTWPLLDCAWVFQEHLLSPRTVFYGQQNIVWKCGAASCDELLGNIRHDSCFYNEHGAIEARPLVSYSQRDDVKRMSTGHLLHSSPYPLDVSNTSQRAIGFYLATWDYLFNDYDTLHLTVEHDRIMAFSGVTRASQLSHGLTYLAGAWAESKQYCLL